MLKRQLLSFLIILLLSILLTACGQDLILDQVNLELEVGESVVLTADPQGDDLKWNTSDSGVAEVDQRGKVTAVGPGTVVITVQSSSEIAQCSVRVLGANIQLGSESIWVGLGEARQVKLNSYTLQEGESLTWASADPEIAEVSPTGMVTGTAPGTTTVSVSAGSQTAVCEVNVFSIPGDLLLAAEETAQIEIDPGAGSKAVKWTSGDPGIAEVDELGAVTGIAPGKVTITASIAGGEAACAVTVLGTVPDSLILKPGETRQVQITPGLDGKTIAWISEDTGVAKVDPSGNITAVAPGMTRVLADTGSTKAACIIFVPLELQKTAEVSGQIGAWDYISPDGNMFISYSPPYGDDFNSAVLMDLTGKEHNLPSPSECQWYGDVFWRGTKFVYSVLPELGEEDPAIYIYNTEDHSDTNIGESINWDKYEGEYLLGLTPVFTSTEVVSVLLPDGLWNYHQEQGSWSHAVKVQGSSGSVCWSPDLTRAAWYERGQEENRLKILDIPSGDVLSVPILEIASNFTWSGDSAKMAWKEQSVLGGNERLVVLDAVSGEVKTVFNQDVIAFTWSGDGSRLAALSMEWNEKLGRIYYALTVFSREGEVMQTLQDPGNPWNGGNLSTTLSWVPGRDMVAYNTDDGVVIRSVINGKRWLIETPLSASLEQERAENPDMYEDIEFLRDHRWLETGNLAISQRFGHIGRSYGVLEIFEAVNFPD